MRFECVIKLNYQHLDALSIADADKIAVVFNVGTVNAPGNKIKMRAAYTDSDGYYSDVDGVHVAETVTITVPGQYWLVPVGTTKNKYTLFDNVFSVFECETAGFDNVSVFIFKRIP